MLSTRFLSRLSSLSQKSAAVLLTSSATLRNQINFHSPQLPLSNNACATTFHFNKMSTAADSLKRKVSEESTVETKPEIILEDQPTKRSKPEQGEDENGQQPEQQMVEQSKQETNEDENKPKVSNEEFGKKFRPRKFAILLSYSGVGYFGLQRNNPFKTIEEEILKVWLKMGLLLPEHYERPQMLYFQRAARTDKGVSAAKQILTCRLPEQFADRIAEMNSLLPDNIRIFGAKRTTKYFDSRTYCDGRTYSYMLPTFALAKPDQMLTTYYRIDKNLMEEFNRVLELYKGTHNFHNFTSGKKATDASAMRFMMEISCGEPFIMEEMEFAIVRIKGQSFMLHQIRKMVGLAIAVMRGNATQATIERAFREEKVDIPIAPGLGLMLEEVHYDRYNIRYGGDGTHEAIVWPELNEQVDEFKRLEILPNVYAGEKKEFSMMKWLQSLPIHTYGAHGQAKSSEEHQKQMEEVASNTQQAIENEINAQKEVKANQLEPTETVVSETTANGQKWETVLQNGSIDGQTVDPELAYRKAYVNAHYLGKEKTTSQTE